MWLSVKALGDASTRLQSVAVGTSILAEGPYGAMTAARRTRNVVPIPFLWVAALQLAGVALIRRSPPRPRQH
ncbi:MAG: hypothetical protein ABI473_04505 [Candidatus Dormibacter sp.]